MCCLLTWVAYLVTLSIEMMWTRVPCWLCCVAINWMILDLMLLTSLVVAVPINQLSPPPKKGRDTFSHTLARDLNSVKGMLFLEKLSGCLKKWLVAGVNAV